MKSSLFAKNTFTTVLLAFILFGNFRQLSRAQDSSPAPGGDANATEVPATLPTDIPPNSPLAQVVQLAQSGVDESVILSFIKSAGSPFNLTSDQIIYLKDLGLPADAVTAMMDRDKQLGAALPTPAPAPVSVGATEADAAQPVVVTQNYFYDTLSPYGGWVNVSGSGLCWRPTVAIYDSNWQPYCDHGHWLNTDAGWYWSSDYAWGNSAFHYGRWFRDPHYGWCWWPETTWAPSWVTWRYANDYCGWAPLPPHTVYRPGLGIYFNGVAVSAGFDFGIRASFFTFVPTRNFNDPHPSRFRASLAQRTAIYNHTTIINNFTVNHHDSHNQIVINSGIPPERITAVTHQKITRVNIEESPTSVPRGQQLQRNTLIIHRPNISQNTVSTLNQGIKPTVIRENNARPNNFSPHVNSQPGQPQTFQTRPSAAINNNQSAIRTEPSTTHINSTGQNNFSTPVEHPVEPNLHVTPNSPNAVAPNNSRNYNSGTRTISPKQEQLEQRAATRNNFNQNPAPERSVVNEPRANNSETRVNNSESAPKNSESSAPSASQKSDKDQNGPGH
jgi:hypothetical protein